MYKINMVKHNDARSNYCPFKNNTHNQNIKCGGKDCMAYIIEYQYFNDENKSESDLKETGLGWCGMVQQQSGEQVKDKIK